MPKYSFLLHVRELPLRPEGSDTVEIGGVYTWRAAEGRTAAAALERAVESLLEDPLLLEEVEGWEIDPIQVEAEEYKELAEDADLEEAESGLVFYLEDDEPDAD